MSYSFTFVGREGMKTERWKVTSVDEDLGHFERMDGMWWYHHASDNFWHMIPQSVDKLEKLRKKVQTRAITIDAEVYNSITC